MRKALLLTAIIASAFVLPGEARAQCTCAPDYVNITPQKEFDLAYAVFVGKVLSVTNGPHDSNDHYVQTVTFNVTKAWKRDLNSTVTITNSI